LFSLFLFGEHSEQVVLRHTQDFTEGVAEVRRVGKSLAWVSHRLGLYYTRRAWEEPPLPSGCDLERDGFIGTVSVDGIVTAALLHARHPALDDLPLAKRALDLRQAEHNSPNRLVWVSQGSCYR
jgi:hypothetical protein